MNPPDGLIARRGVSVVQQPTGWWHVYLDAHFVSTCATRGEAEGIADQLAPIEEQEWDR